MKRIAIIGIPGSGKSTFANKLGKKLGRPVIHLDKEYWTSDWQKKYKKEEWKDFVQELADKDEWIIDGNYHSTIGIRLEKADTVVFFDFPKWRALWRAFIRIFNRKQSFDKPQGAKEKISKELIAFVLNFPQKEIRTTVESCKNKAQVYVVRNNKEINELLSCLTLYSSSKLL